MYAPAVARGFPTRWLSPFLLPIPQDDFLPLIVERYALAALQCRDGHAQRDRVTLACFDVGVRRLAAAYTLHPIFHVRRGGIVVGLGRGFPFAASAIHRFARSFGCMPMSPA